MRPTVVCDGVEHAGEAGALPGGGLVDALPERLQTVHVDDGGGHGHHHAQHRGHQAQATAKLDLKEADEGDEGEGDSPTNIASVNLVMGCPKVFFITILAPALAY